MLKLAIFLGILGLALGQNLNGIELGFPVTWNGDKYGVMDCPANNIPSFIDGYFLCQLSASYGDPTNHDGQKYTNLIDAVGAVGSFHIHNGTVTFQAQYYPAKPYKIWDYYSRDMTKATVAWPSPFSAYNATAMKLWDQIPADPNQLGISSNVAFWTINKTIIGGTEYPNIGYQFDIHTLTDFELFPFIEDNDIFNNDTSEIIPMQIAIHEHMDQDGTIWAGFSAVGRTNMHFYQGVLTVDTKGVRRVVGLYDYGQFNPQNCGADGKYHGDPHNLAGYMHSITATQSYIVLPVTSILFNPCDAPSNSNATIQLPDLNSMVFTNNIGIRFHVFDKRTKTFVTKTPLETVSPYYVAHQLNAFEITSNVIAADMLSYPNGGPYTQYMYRDFILHNGYPADVGVTRFYVDLERNQVNPVSRIPQPSLSVEFPHINYAYSTKDYTWGYMIQNPFTTGNYILKVNVNDASGRQNLVYQAKSSVVVHEPNFIARPNSRNEDDGVIIVRGLDTSTGHGQLIVIDAKTMTEIGSAEVPIVIPFGFHNRFFSSQRYG